MNAIIFETDVQPDRILHLPDDLPIGAHVRIMIKPVSTATSISPDRLADIHRHVQSAAFPVTELESPTMRSVYQGPPLTLQQMREAIDWEVGPRL